MDTVDEQILAVLRDRARTPVSEIARAVGLSSAATGRRIARMESSGVIRGYVAVIDDGAVHELEAFAEIRLTGETGGDTMDTLAEAIPEIVQYFVTAGDPDVLVRFRVRNVGHLHAVVNRIRRSESIVGTKTLMILSAWDRRLGPTQPPEQDPA